MNFWLLYKFGRTRGTSKISLMKEQLYYKSPTFRMIHSIQIIIQSQKSSVYLFFTVWYLVYEFHFQMNTGYLLSHHLLLPGFNNAPS